MGCVRGRDTGAMRGPWMHVGRLWTNGEPFLAVDAALRDAWQGFSSDEFDQVAGLGPGNTSLSVGAGRAAVVGGDGVVRDDSWIEVFEAASGLVAIVQASGPDYPAVLARALAYPDAEDEDCDTLMVSSRELAQRHWYTELDEDNCFARWLLIPVQPHG
jgi:hypothetical protein